MLDTIAIAGFACWQINKINWKGAAMVECKTKIRVKTAKKIRETMIGVNQGKYSAEPI